MHRSVILALLSYASAAPLFQAQHNDAIHGSYIVKLKDGMTTLAEHNLKATISANPKFEYAMTGFRGFAATLSDEEVVRLQGSDQVEYIQQDSMVHASTWVQQNNATWGLARISHVKPNATTYTYDSTAGEGTCAYVIDSGIMVEHPEFEGRASWVADFSDDEELMVDGDGHGTHVAGTIGSATWGVAKKTELLAIRVLDSYGMGTTAGVVAGIGQVAIDAASRKAAGGCPKGVVSNMSLGGYFTKAVNDAAAALVASGVFLAVAAGNEGDDAVNYSPASEPTVCTVGATANNDTLIEWSNYGPMVDILAPGVDITSTYNDGGIYTISGTSMAAPHVVGLAAYLLGLEVAEVEYLCEAIAELATQDTIDERTLPEETVNLLAYNGADERGGYGAA